MLVSLLVWLVVGSEPSYGSLAWPQAFCVEIKNKKQTFPSFSAILPAPLPSYSDRVFIFPFVTSIILPLPFSLLALCTQSRRLLQICQSTYSTCVQSVLELIENKFALCFGCVILILQTSGFDWLHNLIPQRTFFHGGNLLCGLEYIKNFSHRQTHAHKNYNAMICPDKQCWYEDGMRFVLEVLMA